MGVTTTRRGKAHRKPVPMTSIVISPAARRKAAAVATSGVALTMIAATAGSSVKDQSASAHTVDVSSVTQTATQAASINKAVVSSDTEWAAPEETAPAADVTIKTPPPPAPAPATNVHQAAASKLQPVSYGNFPANPQGGIVEVAKQYVGARYVHGGTSPAGFDCSGFVQFVYKHAAGVNLPRTTWAQGAAGHRIPASEAKPGDVVYWGHHVAIYAGNGKIIHASTPATGVKWSNLYGNYQFIRF
ncbi:MAG: NlpC/P60 family protein [Actinomycetaceae bacterium]|nr:NlpC/P60 family protein [Actinomycetaceae bacterium]MDO5746990.1 NlpC/P60 family protein [Actinomycetaceae bacterium]